MSWSHLSALMHAELLIHSDAELPEFDQIEGLNMQMTQAMNHYQREEWRCFVCGTTDHFAQDCVPTGKRCMCGTGSI